MHGDSSVGAKDSGRAKRARELDQLFTIYTLLYRQRTK